MMSFERACAKAVYVVLSTALCAIIAAQALAAECGPMSSCCEPRSCCRCPDDYCSKPLPCVPCAPMGKCDCYCPKPLPCVCPLRYCGPDDYCPKPSCIYLPPCWPAWYTCGSPSCRSAAK